MAQAASSRKDNAIMLWQGGVKTCGNTQFTKNWRCSFILLTLYYFVEKIVSISQSCCLTVVGINVYRLRLARVPLILHD